MRSIATLVCTTKETHHNESYDIYVDGVRIGEIERGENHRGETVYYGNYYKHNGDSKYVYLDGVSGIMQAKQKVVSAWEGAADAVRERSEKRCKARYLPSDFDRNFFPTPSTLIAEMFRLVKWKDVEYILEPEAGKGNIVDQILAHSNSLKLGRKTCEDRPSVEVDCIEIDESLRYILKGKGLRVIHDDYLSFECNGARYDLIIQNPPFSEGARHLLKSISIMERYGGQIVCLLNAETLRNPCTRERKELLRRLAKYSARVEYSQKAFAKAERKTDVEIAIVCLNIPEVDEKSEIFERLKKSGEAHWDNPDPNALMRSGNKIDTLLQAYKVETKAALELMRMYNAMQPYFLKNNRNAGTGENNIVKLNIDGRSCNRIGKGAVNTYLRAVRGKYWDAFFKVPELTKRFTSNIMEKYTSDLKRMADYDFTEFNIRVIMDELYESLASGVHESIMMMFHKLTAKHCYDPSIQNENIWFYNGWKTNKAWKINRRCVLPCYGAIETASWSLRKNQLDSYRVCEELADLEKCLDYIDGGKTAAHDSFRDVIYQASETSVTKNIYTKYMKLTFYKKGTVHIEFHDQRIVDILNIYAGRGKGWLPPSYGKKAYSDMTEEEKQVIDSFQGEEEYAFVCANAEEYLPEARRMLLLEAGQADRSLQKAS